MGWAGMGWIGLELGMGGVYIEGTGKRKGKTIQKKTNQGNKVCRLWNDG